MTTPCTKEAEIARIDERVGDLHKVMFGNGDVGINRKVILMWEAYQMKRAILVGVFTTMALNVGTLLLLAWNLFKGALK